MPWGTIEIESEVERWLRSLPPPAFGRVAWYIDLLEEKGPDLGEPYTRQLRGKLRELRFYLGRRPTRITYYVATGRRIILLTVFQKGRHRERTEIARAERRMQRCIAEGHSAE